MLTSFGIAIASPLTRQTTFASLWLAERTSSALASGSATAAFATISG